MKTKKISRPCDRQTVVPYLPKMHNLDSGSWLPVTLVVAGLVGSWAVPALGDQQSIDELKARDVERMSYYASLRLTPTGAGGAGGGVAGGNECLFDDADDDGMADSWELDQGFDPADPGDAWFDPDSDEVVNLFEFQLDGDPHNSVTPPFVTVAASGAAFDDVGEAIDAVSPGTVIRVAGGAYFVNYITFSERVVMVQGGWRDDFSSRDLRDYPTTFDGQLQDQVLYFSVSSGDPVIILDGIRLVNGNDFFGALNLLAQGTACMRTSVFNCVITDTLSASFGGALNMHDWGSSSSDRTIANTLIVGNPSSGVYSQVVDEGRTHWRLINATISGNWNGGGGNGWGVDAFTLDTGELTAHIYNSIVWGNDPAAFDLEFHNFGSKVLVEIDHSDIGTVDTAGDVEIVFGEGVVDLDPEFVDPDDGDYHIAEGSPLRDLGSTVGLPLTDFEGDPRTVGEAPDLGGDEVPIGCDQAPVWTETTSFLASDGAVDDWFGRSVALDGNVAIVGANKDDDNGEDSGSAYVYRRNGGDWVEEAKLLPSDGGPNNWFGTAAAIRDDMAIIGAPFASSAYSYHFDGQTWVEEAKLIASDGGAGTSFGGAIAISGGVAIIGAQNADNGMGIGTGAAYIFRLQDGEWVEEAKVLPSDGNEDDAFGVMVAIDGALALVGAYHDDDLGESSGSAYIYRFDGSSWLEEAKLLPSGGASFEFFGSSVAVEGDTAFVASYLDNDNGLASGSVYEFRYDGVQWVEHAKLLASDGQVGDDFGNAVAIENDILLVGANGDDDNVANSGSVYVFRFDGSEWIEDTKLTASDGGDDDRFGLYLAISANTAVVTAYRDDDNGLDSGSAYVFDNVSGADCNDNGVPDGCDIADGVSQDNNANGIPDECETIVGDLNGDGLVGTGDLLILLGFWGPCDDCEDCLADLDGDCDVDAVDLITLLGHWG